MKSYLCIGGPLHGKQQTLRDDCSTVAVPVYSQKFIGVEELYDGGGRIRDTRYTVKTLAQRESKEATGSFGATRATVTVDVRTDVLVHESILTVEEAAVYLKKLTGKRPLNQAVYLAMSAITLG